MNKYTSKRQRWAMGTSLCAMLLLSACGGSDLASSLPVDLNSELAATLQQENNSAGDAQIQEAIPQILQGLQDIKQEIRALDGNVGGGGFAPAAPAAPTAPGALPPAAPTAPSTPTAPGSDAAPSAPNTPSAPSAPSAPAKPDPAEQGAAELKALVNRVKTASFVELMASKIEKNLDNGKVSTNKIQMWQKAPNTVKIDILESTSGSAGVKAIYTSGQGDKVKVRPAGGLSFITTDLSKTDDRVTSNNAYRADDIDLIGVTSRVENYKAELVGTTKVEGTTVRILKLSTTGTNTLDSRIAYEYIGYEPDTYKFRLWEVYDKSGAKTPYYRMVIHSIDYPSSLPGSTFKL